MSDRFSILYTYERRKDFKQIKFLGFTIYKKYLKNKEKVRKFFVFPFLKLCCLKFVKSDNVRKLKFLGITLYKKAMFNDKKIKQILLLPFNSSLISVENKREKRKFYILGIKILSVKNKKYNLISDEYKKYVDFLFLDNRNRKNRDTFVPITQDCYKYQDGDTKVIAYYLPQFYQMEINNKFHGQGFTEWTNSSQAIPMYLGHEQPHIPYDVGYYDLLNPNTFKRQAELAKMYGIYGFCMHWYWFSGARTMEKPLELLLEHPEIDLKYCFNWATENWTALWDGGNNELMFKQELKDGDDIKLFNDLLPYFRDERYIKIDNKPLFSIYNIRIFEKERAKVLIANLKKYAKEAGFDGLFVTITNSFSFDEDVSEWGADAINEFPPSLLEVDSYTPEGYIYPEFKGNIYDVKRFISNKLYLRRYKSEKYFRSALVSFDNTARKAYGKNCVIFHGFNPSTFKVWLDDIVKESRKIHKPCENIVFVNNWNEWAEGSHLEPCMRYGYAYLQAVKDVVEKYRPLNTDIVYEKADIIGKDGQINFYVNCIESFGDVVACEPIARHLKEKYPASKVYWLVKKQYKDLVAYNPNIDGVIEVGCLSDAIDVCQEKEQEKDNVIVDCHYDGRICSQTWRVHKNKRNAIVNEQTYFDFGCLLSSFCLSAGLPALKDAPIFWEKPNVNMNYNLPQEYIVFHCKSAEKIKDWTDDKWNKLADMLMKQNYNIVEIGMQKTICSKNKHYFDFTSVTDFQQLAQIIKRAKFFVSVDSGFAHIANCYKIPACILIGKYKTFDFPMPYSGYYAENTDNILYADKKLIAEEKLENVFDKIINKKI